MATQPQPLPLFQRQLGEAWHRLPLPIRLLHDVAAPTQWQGRCQVQRGRHPLAWLIATANGLPQAGDDQPITLTMAPCDEGERWLRQIGGSRFGSLLRARGEPGSGGLSERLGPVTQHMRLVVQAGRLDYRMCGWRLLGVPMPAWLGLRCTAVESSAADGLRFDVEIGHPLTGLIVRYSGWLESAKPTQANPQSPP